MHTNSHSWWSLHSDAIAANKKMGVSIPIAGTNQSDNFIFSMQVGKVEQVQLTKFELLILNIKGDMSKIVKVSLQFDFRKNTG